MPRNYKIINLTVLILLMFAGILTFVFFARFYSFEPHDRQKNATTYMAPSIIDGQRRAVLNEHTDILGQIVYGINGLKLGTLYDAYVDPENAKVKWISVNIDGDLSHPLILVRADKFLSLDNIESEVRLNIARKKFLQYPVQMEHEDRLMELISLRGLPSANIVNSDGQKIGEIISLSYHKGIIDQVYFKAGDLIVPDINTNESRLFSIPFKHLKFIEFNGFDSKAFIGIGLTERQVGAVEKFMQIKENSK